MSDDLYDTIVARIDEALSSSSRTTSILSPTDTAFSWQDILLIFGGIVTLILIVAATRSW